MKNAATDFSGNNLVGNGSTDNTTNLNNIIAGISLPETLYAPTGTYNLNSTPTTLPAGLRLIGDGPDQTVFNGVRASPGSDAVLQMAATGVVLENLHVTTPDTVNAANQCLNVSGASRLRLRGVKFSNAFATGIRASSSAQVLASDCEFTNIYRDPSASGISGSLVQSIFNRCHFYADGGLVNTNHAVYLNGTPANTRLLGCVFEGWSGGSAILLKGNTPPAYAVNLIVSGCSFSGGSNYAIQAQSVLGLQITNNNFQGQAQGAVQLVGDVQHYLISGNTAVNGASNDAGWICYSLTGGCGNGLIEGNQMSSFFGTYVFGTGVAVFNNTENLTIRGNQFSGLYSGVTLQNNSTGAVKGVSIYENDFTLPAGAVDATTGGKFVVGLAPHETAGILIAGGASNVEIRDNRCHGVKYELAFSTGILGAVGHADKVHYEPGIVLGQAGVTGMQVKHAGS